ncbi:succinylglutamate desuccinylase/aspartoacylase family protein [Ekhidna sp.]
MTKIKVHSKALEKTIGIDRVIGEINGLHKGPTLIFMGGIHGNEPAGVFALNRFIESMRHLRDAMYGNIICLTGNLGALREGIRFHDEDLNRVWTRERMASLSQSNGIGSNNEVNEQREIFSIIQHVLDTHSGPFYFFDLHTTSSETIPFLTVNDSLLNRDFTIQYPLHIILGIEEYLDGPILSYINELGYVAFGFEAGQHDDMSSIENNMAFCYLSAVFTGLINKDLVDYHHYHDMLAKTSGDVQSIYEIHFRYLIKTGELFTMETGFFNFQKVYKNQLVAKSDGKEVRAKNDGRIFMPLYQAQGSDGFFTIKKIWKPFLRISAIIRKYRLDRMLVLLPGVKWIDHSKSGLIVNKKIARFLAREIFHLFGYRSMVIDKNHAKMFYRDASARFEEYLNQPWITH